MNPNTPPRFKLTRLQRKEITAHVKDAAADTDPASLIVLGPSLQEATGCVVVLKGNDTTRWMHDLLVRQKLLTPNKPIANSATV